MIYNRASSLEGFIIECPLLYKLEGLIIQCPPLYKLNGVSPWLSKVNEHGTSRSQACAVGLPITCRVYQQRAAATLGLKQFFSLFSRVSGINRHSVQENGTEVEGRATGSRRAIPLG